MVNGKWQILFAGALVNRSFHFPFVICHLNDGIGPRLIGARERYTVRMADPLQELHKRLNNPRERTVEGQYAEGRAWAAEVAHQLCLAGFLAHFNLFTIYLTLAVKYGSGAMPVSEAEAKLLHACCASLCSGCNQRLIAKLKLRARFSRHVDEIAAACELLRDASAIDIEGVKRLQALFTLLRAEEVLATPVSMGGKFVAQKAPERWKSGRRTWPMV